MNKGDIFRSLRRSKLAGNNCGVLRRGSNTRPTIWVIERGGIRAVVKDFSGNRFFFRNTVGRFLIWREAKAYGKLKEINGVPECYGVLDGLALIVEEIPGRSLENLEKERKLPRTFFDAMDKLVRSVHERGVAHCDLKRAPNTLLGTDGRPYIVDWAAAISKEEFRLPPLNLIFRRFQLDDEMAVVKLALRHAPTWVSAKQKARYDYRSTGEKIVRAVRDKLRELLQKAV